MANTFNVILIMAVLYALYLYIQKNKKEAFENNINIRPKSVEKFNTDNLYFESQEPIISENVSFDYNLREVDKQFLREQEFGVNLKCWYPNTWIEKPDAENPVYATRENNVNMLDSRATNSYEFNNVNFKHMDGVLDPETIQNSHGKTLREIYDNSFVDFKKMIPPKKIINDEPYQNTSKGASNLNFLTSDVWLYENEKPENGGQIAEGLFAVDPSALGSVATF